MVFGFIMNGRDWLVKEVDQETMFSYYNEENVGYYYGQTHFATQEIWVSNELSNAQKIKTLYHELVHCYINMFITCKDLEYDEELCCDIAANSAFIICDIIDDYTKELKHYE